MGEMRCAAELMRARSSRAVERHREHLQAARAAILSVIESQHQQPPASHTLYLAALVHAEARNVREAKHYAQR